MEHQTSNSDQDCNYEAALSSGAEVSFGMLRTLRPSSPKPSENGEEEKREERIKRGSKGMKSLRR